MTQLDQDDLLTLVPQAYHAAAEPPEPEPPRSASKHSVLRMRVILYGVLALLAAGAGYAQWGHHHTAKSYVLTASGWQVRPAGASHAADIDEIRLLLADYMRDLMYAEGHGACDLLSPVGQARAAAGARRAGLATCSDAMLMAGLYTGDLVATGSDGLRARIRERFLDMSGVAVTVAPDGRRASAGPWGERIAFVKRAQSRWSIEMPVWPSALGSLKGLLKAGPGAPGQFASDADLRCVSADAVVVPILKPLNTRKSAEARAPQEVATRLAQFSRLADHLQAQLLLLHPPAAEARIFDHYLQLQERGDDRLRLMASEAADGDVKHALADFRALLADESDRAAAKALHFQVC